MSPPRRNLAELLASMPDVGLDADFERQIEANGATAALLSIWMAMVRAASDAKSSGHSGITARCALARVRLRPQAGRRKGEGLPLKLTTTRFLARVAATCRRERSCCSNKSLESG